MQFKSFLILILSVSLLASVFYNNLNTSRSDEVHINEVTEKDKVIKETERQYNQALEELEELKTKNELLEGELTTCKAERQLLVENW